MPTDPHLSCCQQENNVCRRPYSQRWGHQDLPVCTSALLNTKLWRFAMLLNIHKIGWVHWGPHRRNYLCFSFSGQVTEFSLHTKYLLFYNGQHFAGFHADICMFCIKKKGYTSCYMVQENSGYQVKKELNTLSSFRKMLIFNVSLLGLWRH